MDECGRAAAVEVDRVVGAESGDQVSEFGEGQAGVDAGAAAVADERGQLLVGEGERGAWVAAGGDVGVELVGAGDEALRVVEVAERGPVADEQRAGLQQVAGGLGPVARRGARSGSRLARCGSPLAPPGTGRGWVRSRSGGRRSRARPARGRVGGGRSRRRSPPGRRIAGTSGRAAAGRRSARCSASSRAAGSGRRRRLSARRRQAGGGEARNGGQASASAPVQARLATFEAGAVAVWTPCGDSSVNATGLRLQARAARCASRPPLTSS